MKNYKTEIGLGRLFLVALNAFILAILILLFEEKISILYLLIFCASIIILIDYKKGIFFAVLLLPFSATNLIPRSVLGITGLNPLNVLLVFTLFSMLAARFNRQLNNLLPLSYPILLYIILIILGAFIGSFQVSNAIVIVSDVSMEVFTEKKYLLDNLFKPLIIIIVSWMIGTSILNGRVRIKEEWFYLWAMVLSCLIYFIILLNYLLFSGIELSVLASSRSREFLSFIGGIHANDLGLMANLFLAIFLCSALSCQKKSTRAYLLTAAAAAGLTASVTFSRAAFVGIFVICIYYFLSYRKFKYIVLGGVIIATIALILPGAFVDRATTGFETGDVNMITAGRVEAIWLPLWPVFMDSPIFGHGLRSTIWIPPRFQGSLYLVGHPHNAYLEVLLDFGLIGLVVIGLFFWSMWRLFRSLMTIHPDTFWRGVFEGGSLCLLVLMAQAVSGTTFYPSYTHVPLWIVYGIAMAHKIKLVNDKMTSG